MGLETSPPTLEGREGGTVPLNGWGGGGQARRRSPGLLLPKPASLALGMAQLTGKGSG